MAQATYDDVNLILRLYEMRREDRLRAARAWFSANFKVKTLADFDKLCPKGSDADAYTRQVISYWEMVASFITSGVLSEELFFQSGQEMMFVWLRLEPILEAVRERTEDPAQYRNLETVAKSFSAYLKKLTPKGFENWAARVRS